MSVRWTWNRCARHKKRIALLISGVLPHEEEAALEAHLNQCGSCRRYYAELKPIGLSLAQAGGTLPEAEPNLRLSDRWKRVVRAEPKFQERISGLLVGAVLEPRREGGRLRLGEGLGRKATWAGFAAAWGLILFFNLTAPEVERFPAGRVNGAPRAMLQLLRRQDEWLALRQSAWERRQDARRVPPNPNSASPRSRRKTNLLLV
jgi:anti-sigma factor RsiW